MDYSLPGSSIHGISQAILERPFPSPGHLPDPGIRPWDQQWQVAPLIAGGLLA